MALARAESQAHPERWRVRFLGRDHPTVRALEPLDPAGGYRWLRYYPPRLIAWRVVHQPRDPETPPSSSDEAEEDNAEEPSVAEESTPPLSEVPSGGEESEGSESVVPEPR
jgi:hypothetical protein